MRVRKMISGFVRLVLAGSIAMLVLLQTAFAAETKIDENNFPDENFREWVSENVDTNKNGTLSAAEIAAVKRIIIESSPIQSLKGIGIFTELTYLYYNWGELVGMLDLRQNVKLLEVDVGFTPLAAIDVSTCSKLESLNISYTQIRALDVSKNTSLMMLTADHGCLEYLDLSRNTNLWTLSVPSNRLTSLNLSKLTNLRYLYCSGNPLTKLDLSKCKELIIVDCSKCALTSITTGTALTKLETLNCSRNDLQSLDVSAVPLASLKAHGNRLTAKTLKVGGALREYLSFDATCLVWDDYDLSEGVGLSVVKYESDNNTVMVDQAFAIGADITVTFFRAGWYPEGNTVKTTQKAGKPFTIPKITVQPADAYFLGWSLASSATEPQYKTGDTITVYRDCVLYPVVKIHTYKVTFNLNGGTSGAPAAITGIPVYIDAIIIPASTPVREGYYFMGWNTEGVLNDNVLKSGDAFFGEGVSSELYAVWKPRTNKISFNLNGGSGTTPATISVLSGKNATIPKANVSRSNYWFLGWSTNKNATTATYKSGDKLSVTKDTVLYAVWKLNGYMLTFDANGGTNPPAKITAAKGATVTIPKSSVKRDGYWFLGWATSKTATAAQYKSGSTLKLTANTTLYAVWKKK